MSTSYYRLKEPITSLQSNPTHKESNHFKLSIWINHQLAGVLIVSDEEKCQLMHIFADRNKHPVPIRTHWGGKEKGTVITINDKSLPDNMQLISDYGELLTVAEIKARDGAKRQNGWPTELFGYQNKLKEHSDDKE